MPQNLIEKIAQRHAIDLAAGHAVRAGDFLSVGPAHVMTHDNTAAVMVKFDAMGASRIFDPAQPVFALDHDIQNKGPENRAKYEKIEAFAQRHGVAFHPAGRGIGHQVMVEEGFVLPGAFVVGSDSHSNLYGALGALGTPVVRTDAAAIWATGRTWWQVPEIVRINLSGKLQPGVSGKDVIIALIGTFNHDEVLNTCLEFAGSGIAGLRMDERMAIANMTTEWGALAGVFPYDTVTRDFLRARAKVMRDRGDNDPRLTHERIEEIESNLPTADRDAHYAKEIDFDLSAVTPFVAGPNEVKTIVSLPEMEQRDIKIDKAYLLSCVNGRLEDFVEAAKVLEGKHVADGVTLYIAAASSEIETEAKRLGHWDTLLGAGAVALPPGCGPCIGLGDGILKDGEVGISATNRNFKGRMGSRDSAVYLASPIVVAASAIAGRIAGTGRIGTEDPDTLRTSLEHGASVRVNPRTPAVSGEVAILAGFPESIEGELLFVPKDNMNTDGIYGKDYTYKEGMTPEQMAKVAMENYDPQFQQLAKEGDILVGGYNFGTGSSREQAATALKHRGIKMVIAGSFSQTYKRNAFNNGYICIECAELVDDLKTTHVNDDARVPHPSPSAKGGGRSRGVHESRTSRIVTKPHQSPTLASQGWGTRADDGALTIRTGRRASVDFTRARIECRGKTYGFAALGTVAQELIVSGGFEAVIQKELRS